jgi:type VI secretion system protein ImpG
VITPSPATVLVEATSDDRLVEPVTVPAGTQLRVSAPDGRVGIFSTTLPFTALPAVIEGASLIPRDHRLFLQIRLRALRPFRCPTISIHVISIHVRSLNDYRASLALHDAIARHTVRAFAEIDGRPAEVPCRVTFGEEAPRKVEDDHGSPGPLARVRSFLHLPDRDLFLHAVIADPWARTLVINLELDPAFPTDLAVTDDTFRLSVAPAENVWSDFAEPILCDGTRDSYPIRHPSPVLAAVEMFGLRGVYRADAPIAPILPAALSQEGDWHDLDDGDGGPPALRLHLAGAFEKPAKVLVDARWSQPALWTAAPGRLAIALQTKHVPGVSLRPLGSLRRPEESPLARDPARVLDLLSLRMRPALERRDLAGVLEILGTTADGPYRGAHTWVDDLSSAEVADPAKAAGGIRRAYQLALRQRSAEDAPLVARLAAYIARLLDAWTEDAVDVEITTRKEARLYSPQGALPP